ncbi:MAG: hypothetical protein Q8O40_00700 [Chloroflexota bacterium]|nr:hypothetical protein [Chloroflexota bacterium]
MRYWKRVDGEGKTTTVESYSHDLDVQGAIEINEAEYDAFVALLSSSPQAIDAQLQEQKRQAARERAIASIKANKGQSPWGQALHDLAVAQGLIDP